MKIKPDYDPRSRKNVLLITVDHWPGRLLGCRGRDDFLSPTVDSLARCGVRFENAYSANPVCIPARRSLMTGTFSKSHGDRVFNENLRMPECDTLPQVFRNNGYQAIGVGKIHVYPQRDRIGFDDIILNEEGRRVNYPNEMRDDDYSRYLNRMGYSGVDYAHGMSTNNYLVRPWHLSEELHQTSWTARQMCEQIIRRDPTRPAFWYCGFTAPHPPIVPPQVFLDKYDDVDIEMPFNGDWAADFDDLPYCLKYYSSLWEMKTEKYIRDARKGFYALCTHIDYSIRSIIGTLREEKVLDNTIIALTCDHGDMLGNHGLWAKNLFYEDSTKIPLIIVPTNDDTSFTIPEVDDRTVELCDVMPTLLSMCGLEIPSTVEGLDLTVPEAKRDYLYGELWEDDRATRMIRGPQHKLIYYAVGNRFQLFDLQNDPDELHNLAEDPAHAEVLEEYTRLLMAEIHGSDREWIRDGKLVGLSEKEFRFRPSQSNCGVLSNRELLLQRGYR